jgi:hypothetical protein
LSDQQGPIGKNVGKSVSRAGKEPGRNGRRYAYGSEHERKTTGKYWNILIRNIDFVYTYNEGW